MKKIRFTKRALFLALIAIANCVSADDSQIKPIGVGDTFKSYTFENPQEEPKTLKSDTKLVLMSFEMEISKGIHTWLESKEPDFLEKHHTEYVADITKMPGIITFLFARPKMKKYAFPILLADDDEFAPQFPKEEGKFVVFELSPEKVVTNISYFPNMDDVNKAYFSRPEPTPTPAPTDSPVEKKLDKKSKR